MERLQWVAHLKDSFNRYRFINNIVVENRLPEGFLCECVDSNIDNSSGLS